MLSLIFFPIYLAVELVLLPIRLAAGLIRGAAGLSVLCVIGALSMFGFLFNVLRPLMGIVCLAAGLTLLFRVFQEKGGMDWLDQKLQALRVRR